ncbi:hypothetical protein A2U01_0072689, partial [Trifolium medium]|nr:hypothetical protein [Trifolium medium]
LKPPQSTLLYVLLPGEDLDVARRRS